MQGAYHPKSLGNGKMVPTDQTVDNELPCGKQVTFKRKSMIESFPQPRTDLNHLFLLSWLTVAVEACNSKGHVFLCHIWGFWQPIT